MRTVEDDVMVKKIADPVCSSPNLMDSTSLQPETTTSEHGDGLNNEINFEGTAKQMADLKASIFNTPETNHTKIQFIKEELSADRYQIHCNHIASKILEYAELQEEAEIA